MPWPQEEVFANINLDLSKIQKWLRENNLFLNLEKPIYYLIGSLYS